MLVGFSELVHCQAQDGVQGFHEAYISLVCAAGPEQFPERSRIFLYSLLHGQEHVANHDDGCMGDLAVEVLGLKILFQAQVPFAHLEEDLDVPTLSVNWDHFFVGQVNVGGQKSQQLLFATVT